MEIVGKQKGHSTHTVTHSIEILGNSKDLVRNDKEEVNIVYCPTEHMVADFFTKPLQGKQFIEFRNKILGIDVNPDFIQERVGQ